MRNIETMKGKLAERTKEARALIEAAQKEERSLTAEEREKQDKLMNDIRDMQADIVAEEILQEQESRAAKVPDDPEKDLAEWRSLGDFVHAVAKNPNDKRLKGREAEERIQSQGTGLEGGFLVPDIFASTLLTVSPDEAIVRPRAQTFGGASSTGFGELHIPALQYSGNNMYAGAVVQWIGEGQPKPETDIEFKRITLHPYEVAAHVQVTDRLLRNASMIEQVVSTQLRGALIAAEENAFLNGAGGVQPTGIIGHAATIGVARAGAAAVVYQDLADMLAVFWGKRGVWITGRDMLPQLMDLQDPNNNYVWQPNARDGNPGTIFGMPVLFSDDSPALGLDGDVVLADLSNYLIGDGGGVAIAASSDFLFTSNMTVIKAWKLVDGSPWLTGPLPTSIPTSPFVQLDA
jgi:HK97 family phage major capsid protein